MKCPACGGAELVYGVKPVAYSFRGQKTHIEAAGLHCSACGEVVMDREESNAYQSKLREFKSAVIARTIEPEFVLQVRKKLALTQAEASQIFGGGVNAFSKYERGISQPHPSTIQLLKVLDRHPELLAEIRS